MKAHPAKLKLFATLLLAFVLAGCGASKSSKSDESSRLAGDTAFDEYNGGSGVYTNCNAIPNNDIGLAGPISTFYDPSAGAYIDDLIRIKFNDVPSRVVTSTTQYIEIYRWKEDYSYNQEPVQIYFQLKGSGRWIDEPVTTLSRATIQKVIVDNNLVDLGYNTNNFFDGVIMTMAGMDLQWDAITIYLFDQDQGDTPIGQVDALIPAFDANPNSYASTHPQSALQVLHPMWTVRNSGYTNENYFNSTFNLCSGF